MEKIKNILLVEDNLQDLELTIEALTKYNLANNIATATDGVKAMQYLRYEGEFKNRSKGQPALILLDIKMPRMDGIEVLEALSKDEKLRTIPVVMLTSSREEPDLEKCYDLGVNAYVVKPVNFKEFIEAVKQIGVFWAVINELPSAR